ncbi:MAG TPA: hydroxysqualene dehydroxylase HpnE [Pirellulales bacterium]|nr:hydroxysqualene dehydroxylase HpnE [Pirellulales bacterium]
MQGDGGSARRVAIVGGGLAGLAAAVAMVERGWQVELFESRRQFGGRVASFRDPATGELVDYCQHVSLGCCTKLADFCKRTGIAEKFRRDRVLHFFTAEGRRYDLRAARFLPPPLHLVPALLRLGYLSWRERIGLARGLRQLARSTEDDETIGSWLRRHGQSQRAIERFWAVVLNSALGDSIDRASVKYARKVFVDAFLTSRDGHEVLVPIEPLSELFGTRVVDWLREHGASVHSGRGVERVEICDDQVRSLRLNDGSQIALDAAIVAVPWRYVLGLFDEGELAGPLASLRTAEEITGAPITGVHLWFDRPITPLPHAVLVGLQSQWLFNRGDNADCGGHYYQVVISASYELASLDRERIVERIVAELKGVWPSARDAVLLNARVVTDASAVFSPVPGIDRLRPPQRTTIANLAIAGDWTSTGWPSTMEGAVRSGYLAAEAISDSTCSPCGA